MTVNSALLNADFTARPRAAAVFSCPNGARMRRHGAAARKEGQRQDNGRLKWTPKIVAGSDTTIDQRAIMVGRKLAEHAHAGFPLGVLRLRGLLADERLSGKPEEKAAQNEERFRAGLHFAAHHQIVWGGGGPRRPQSHLQTIIDGLRRQYGGTQEPSRFVLEAAEKFGKMVAAVRLLPGPSNPFPYHVLERIVLAEEYQLTPIELDGLRRALQAIADLG